MIAASRLTANTLTFPVRPASRIAVTAAGPPTPVRATTVFTSGFLSKAAVTACVAFAVSDPSLTSAIILSPGTLEIADFSPANRSATFDRPGSRTTMMLLVAPTAFLIVKPIVKPHAVLFAPTKAARPDSGKSVLTSATGMPAF